MNKKSIIFFDGDGTLWYPKKTRYKKHPVWIYKDKRIKHHVNHLKLIPTVIDTLIQLKKKGIITVILSTHPQPPEIAHSILKTKVEHFNLQNLFDEFHPTRPYPESKGEFISKIIKKRKIPKSKALMVGDSYIWDYRSAKDKGIDALLIKSGYEPMQDKLKYTISQLNQVFRHIS